MALTQALISPITDQFFLLYCNRIHGHLHWPQRELQVAKSKENIAHTHIYIYTMLKCIHIYIYTYYHTISSYIIYIHLSFCLDKPAWVLTVSGNFLSDVWRLMASHLGLGSTGGSPSVLTAWYGALAMGQNGTQSSHLGTQFWLATIHTQSASEWWNTWC
jgi:hypothetical protein